MKNELIKAAKLALEALREINDPHFGFDVREEIARLNHEIERAEQIMNIEQTKIEITLEYLNGLAKHYNDDLLTSREFMEQTAGAMNFAAHINFIDRVEQRILRDQAIAIKNGEFEAFEDPEGFMFPEDRQKECGYDLDNRNEVN